MRCLRLPSIRSREVRLMHATIFCPLIGWDNVRFVRGSFHSCMEGYKGSAVFSPSASLLFKVALHIYRTFPHLFPIFSSFPSPALLCYSCASVLSFFLANSGVFRLLTAEPTQSWPSYSNMTSPKFCYIIQAGITMYLLNSLFKKFLHNWRR